MPLPTDPSRPGQVYYAQQKIWVPKDMADKYRLGEREGQFYDPNSGWWFNNTGFDWNRIASMYKDAGKDSLTAGVGMASGNPVMAAAGTARAASDAADQGTNKYGGGGGGGSDGNIPMPNLPQYQDGPAFVGANYTDPGAFQGASFTGPGNGGSIANQQAALGDIKGVYQAGGLGPQDLAAFWRAKAEANDFAKQQRGAIEQQARMQGGGAAQGGNTALMQMQSAQGDANRLADADVQQAGIAAQRRQAMMLAYLQGNAGLSEQQLQAAGMQNNFNLGMTGMQNNYNLGRAGMQNNFGMGMAGMQNNYNWQNTQARNNFNQNNFAAQQQIYLNRGAQQAADRQNSANQWGAIANGAAAAYPYVRDFFGGGSQQGGSSPPPDIQYDTSWMPSSAPNIKYDTSWMPKS